MIRTKLALLVLLTGLLALEVGGLKAMSYSTGWMQRISLARALQPRSPLALGPLDWAPARYRGDPKLQPFVRVVQEHCAGLAALETTVCLSDLMATRFPHGEPSEELFNASFDPVAALNHHLAGEPGHCVSRSGILATALLAVGIPARLVQLVSPVPGTGHNAIEVWDQRFGWIFFDPTLGGSAKTAAGEQSAAALLAAGGGLTWVQLGKIPGTTNNEPLDGRLWYAGNPTPRFSGNLVYPEPWLYTRVGVKQTPPPFRSMYMVVGPPSLQLAIGHWLIQGAIVITALAALGVAISVVLKLARLATGRLRVPEDVAEEAAVVRRGADDAAE